MTQLRWTGVVFKSTERLRRFFEPRKFELHGGREGVPPTLLSSSWLLPISRPQLIIGLVSTVSTLPKNRITASNDAYAFSTSQSPDPYRPGNLPPKPFGPRNLANQMKNAARWPLAECLTRPSLQCQRGGSIGCVDRRIPWNGRFAVSPRPNATGDCSNCRLSRRRQSTRWESPRRWSHSARTPDRTVYHSVFRRTAALMAPMSSTGPCETSIDQSYRPGRARLGPRGQTWRVGRDPSTVAYPPVHGRKLYLRGRFIVTLIITK